jgi:hypothetical protein
VILSESHYLDMENRLLGVHTFNCSQLAPPSIIPRQIEPGLLLPRFC